MARQDIQDFDQTNNARKTAPVHQCAEQRTDMGHGIRAKAETALRLIEKFAERTGFRNVQKIGAETPRVELGNDPFGCVVSSRIGIVAPAMGQIRSRKNQVIVAIAFDAIAYIPCAGATEYLGQLVLRMKMQRVLGRECRT